MLFLYDVQSPINIGLTLRAAEQFQRTVALFDPRHVLADPHNVEVISCHAAGAFERRPPLIVESLLAFRDAHSGRIVAGSLKSEGPPLHQFGFRDDDTVVLGNEEDGLPSWLIEHADAGFHITPRAPKAGIDGAGDLNLSHAAALISYSWRMQQLMKDLDAIDARAARIQEERAKAG